MSVNSSATGGRGFAWWSALVVLLSAFLLFQVQPVISKMILPWFGGSPAVWTTCMLFFQVALLAGYAYAHWLSQSHDAGRQAFIHVVLLGAAILLLPIIPGDAWKPSGSEHPTTRILLLLSVCVGLPYFALASTGPLVQAWFARVCPDRSPYWLYALSNIGSLGALLSYPFWIEPMFGTRTQGIVWSVGFGLFALACGGLVLTVRKVVIRQEATEPTSAGRESIGGSKNAVDAKDLPSITNRLLWLALPALSTTCLLAITNHLCQDVAVVPFLWVAPLSLYLLSFILCFAGPNWYWRGFWSVLTAASVVFVSLLQLEYQIRSTLFNTKIQTWLVAFEERFLNAFEFLHLRHRMEQMGLAGFSVRDLNECIVTHVLAYLTCLFSICMLCHGEMVRRKPEARHLTAFYMMTSAGGALGGICVALICPAMFFNYLELNWALCLAFAVAWMVMFVRTVGRLKSAQGLAKWSFAIFCTVAFAVLSGGSFFAGRALSQAHKSEDVATARSFYGVLHVVEFTKSEPDLYGNELLNGRILHGMQLQAVERRRQPTTYYTRGSGPEIAISTTRRLAIGGSRGLFRPDFPGDGEGDDLPFPREIRGRRNLAPIRIGVIGLGVGTMAAYGEEGDVVRFYEINPQVIDFANRHFSFVKDCPGKVEIVQGDARLAMEREETQQYDVFVLDAFSGDAIPVHLLTDEAIRIYRRHLKPTGVLVIHVSNRHLDLVPVVATLARHHQMQVALINFTPTNDELETPSEWMLVSANENLMTDPAVVDAARELEESRFQGPLWTDQHSNLFQILK